MDTGNECGLDSGLEPRFVNFIYALVVGHACANCDRFEPTAWDIWDDEICVMAYAGLILQCLPFEIKGDWYSVMAKRQPKQKTVSEYLSENAGNLPPKRAANWIIKNWHMVTHRKLNSAKESYFKRCSESVTFNIEHPDDEYAISPRVQKAYDLITGKKDRDNEVHREDYHPNVRQRKHQSRGNASEYADGMGHGDESQRHDAEEVRSDGSPG